MEMYRIHPFQRTSLTERRYFVYVVDGDEVDNAPSVPE